MNYSGQEGHIISWINKLNWATCKLIVGPGKSTKCLSVFIMTYSGQGGDIISWINKLNCSTCKLIVGQGKSTKCLSVFTMNYSGQGGYIISWIYKLNWSTCKLIVGPVKSTKCVSVFTMTYSGQGGHIISWINKLKWSTCKLSVGQVTSTKCLSIWLIYVPKTYLKSSIFLIIRGAETSANKTDNSLPRFFQFSSGILFSGHICWRYTIYLVIKSDNHRRLCVLLALASIESLTLQEQGGG